MSDTLKAILTSGPMWTALIAAISGTILYLNPSFPRELLVLYVGFAVAILGAFGVQGVQGVQDKSVAITLKRAAKEKGLDVSEPGQDAYGVYRAVMGSGFDDRTWSELSDTEKRAWAAAGSANYDAPRGQGQG